MIALRVLIISFFAYSKLFGQTNDIWSTIKVNEILELKFPAKYDHSNLLFVKAYGGYIKSDYFGLQFFDTVFNRINTGHDFQIGLTGFIHGVLSDTTLINYKVSIVDSAFGKTKGIMVKLKASDSAEFYKKIYYYATIANDNLYWFYTYSESTDEDSIATKTFFASINFDEKKVKENSFVLTSIYLGSTK